MIGSLLENFLLSLVVIAFCIATFLFLKYLPDALDKGDKLEPNKNREENVKPAFKRK